MTQGTQVYKSQMKTVSAKLRRGTTRLGWTQWWLVDGAGNLLNTEPVCLTPEDKWHPWFITILESLHTPYWGVKESPDDPGDPVKTD